MSKKVLILVLLLLGLLVRLYKVDQPIADWHSHRQADTASVTRNFVNQGINLFLPTYHDLSDVQSGQPNPHGYRLVELPIFNAVSALTFKIASPFISIEITQRLINIFFSLSSAFLLFLVALKLFKSFEASVFTLITFLFLPFNIYYSRTILPEPLAVFFMVLSLYFLVNQKVLLSAIPLSLSILIKPYTALLLFPFITYCFIHKSYFLNHKSQVLLFMVISLIPFIGWRLWISNYPEGIPVSNWLLNGGGIRFRPAWFRWLFDERIAKLILGSFGLIPLFLGFAYKKDKSQITLFLLSLGVFIYFAVIARGNVQHDYYQVLIVPTLALILGSGIYYIHHFVFDNKFLGLLSGILILTAAISFSSYQVKEYYKINNLPIIESGKIADQLLPKNAVVIAPYTGDTAFLYQTNRAGWPTEIYDVNSVKNLVSPKPLYLVSVNFDQYTNMMMQTYPTIYKTTQLVILDLN